MAAVGLVAARRLHNWGANVHVFITHSDQYFKGIPAKQLEILRRMGVPVTIGSGMVLRGTINVDLIIDAVIGYSLGGNPQGEAAEFIRWANAHDAPILSLDTPSGLELTNGQVFEPAIRATATMTGVAQRGFCVTKRAEALSASCIWPTSVCRLICLANRVLR